MKVCPVFLEVLAIIVHFGIRCIKIERKYLIAVNPFRPEHINVWILVVCCLVINVILEVSEHGAVLHVMSVEEGVPACKCRVNFAVHKHASCAVFLHLKRVMQVELVILPLNNRVIDLSSRSIQPADKTSVYLLKAVEIDLHIRKIASVVVTFQSIPIFLFTAVCGSRFGLRTLFGCRSGTDLRILRKI